MKSHFYENIVARLAFILWLNLRFRCFAEGEGGGETYIRACLLYGSSSLGMTMYWAEVCDVWVMYGGSSLSCY